MPIYAPLLPYLLCAGMIAGTIVLPAPASADDFAPVTAKIQGWVDRGYYPGAGLIVAQNNRVIYNRCFGTYQPDTEVYIASAGKWLAAATIAVLVDRGKLAWDDPVSRWLPEFKDAKGKATLRQLLSHTSGFPAYQPDNAPPDNYQTLAESVAHLVPLPPAALPGERFDYGGLAMQAAGRMAEMASGKDWETLFQETIARPCRMTRTHFTPVERGHIPMIGGGARSTLQDYSHFLQMIANDGVFEGKRVLSAKAIHEMQADQVRGAKVSPGKEFVERARGLTHQSIYGLGEWREMLDAKGAALLISSPSWAGAYPWIDKRRHLYGFFIAHVAGPTAAQDKFDSFYSSPVLAPMIADLLDRRKP